MSVVEPGPARVVLLERNRVLSARIARVLGAADALGPVAIVDDPRSLAPQQLAPARLIACDANDLDVAIGWLGHAPRARLVVWSGESTVPLIARAARHEALSNLVGWPSFDSMPRAWELLYVARRLLGEPAPPLRELLPWGAAHTKFRPHTTAELESTVAAVLDLSERAGASPRSALRISEAAHELLMNAMYDAPVDQYGEKRFAFERQRAIELEPEEAPTLRFATDGSRLAVEVLASRTVWRAMVGWSSLSGTRSIEGQLPQPHVPWTETSARCPAHRSRSEAVTARSALWSVPRAIKPRRIRCTAVPIR